MLEDMLSNRILQAAVLAWLIAQVLKVVLVLIFTRTLDFSRFVGAGGMPSSHSALVCALAMAIGQQQGFNTAVFAVALSLALIVMYDAAGVRRAAGKQAEVLNKMVEDLYQGKHIDGGQLKELLGHTPTEVLAGAILGCIVGYYV